MRPSTVTASSPAALRHLPTNDRHASGPLPVMAASFLSPSSNSRLRWSIGASAPEASASESFFGEGDCDVAPACVSNCSAFACAFAELLLCRSFAELDRLLDISADLASSASILLCFHPSAKKPCTAGRARRHSAGVMQQMRDNWRSSSGNSPAVQYSMISSRYAPCSAAVRRRVSRR